MVPFHILGMVSYQCATVTLSPCTTHRFWDIRLQKCRDLEIRVRGLWRSLKMSPFERHPMTSYWCSVLTMALSRVFLRYSMSKNMSRLWNPGQRLLKLI